MENNTVDNQLNDLIQYLQDSRNGYKESSDNVNDISMKKILLDLSEKRNRMLEELNKICGNLSAFKEKNGTLLGKAHRTFVSLKGLLMRKDTDSIKEEIKRGEDVLIDMYKQILKEPLNNNINQILTKQLWEIENDLVTVEQKAKLS